MFSGQQISQMSDDAAYRAARDSKSPLIPWKAEDVTQAPFLGTYRAPGWRALRWDEVSTKPRTTGVYRETATSPVLFMVDSSGFGGRDEPALTVTEAEAYVMRVARLDPKTKRLDIGVGIVEAGQFQIVLGLFVRDRAPYEQAAPSRPEGYCDECESSVLCDHDEPVVLS